MDETLEDDLSSRTLEELISDDEDWMELDELICEDEYRLELEELLLEEDDLFFSLLEIFPCSLDHFSSSESSLEIVGVEHATKTTENKNAREYFNFFVGNITTSVAVQITPSKLNIYKKSTNIHAELGFCVAL